MPTVYTVIVDRGFKNVRIGAVRRRYPDVPRRPRSRRNPPSVFRRAGMSETPKRSLARQRIVRHNNDFCSFQVLRRDPRLEREPSVSATGASLYHGRYRPAHRGSSTEPRRRGVPPRRVRWPGSNVHAGGIVIVMVCTRRVAFRRERGLRALHPKRKRTRACGRPAISGRRNRGVGRVWNREDSAARSGR